MKITNSHRVTNSMLTILFPQLYIFHSIPQLYIFHSIPQLCECHTLIKCTISNPRDIPLGLYKEPQAQKTQKAPRHRLKSPSTKYPNPIKPKKPKHKKSYPNNEKIEDIWNAQPWKKCCIQTLGYFLAKSLWFLISSYL